MEEKFCCSSVTMFQYLSNYLDPATQEDNMTLTVQGGLLAIREFKGYQSISVEPTTVKLNEQVPVGSLIRLKNLCRMIPDQPITISITTSSWLDIQCTL